MVVEWLYYFCLFSDLRSSKELKELLEDARQQEELEQGPVEPDQCKDYFFYYIKESAEKFITFEAHSHFMCVYYLFV